MSKISLVLIIVLVLLAGGFVYWYSARNPVQSPVSSRPASSGPTQPTQPTQPTRQPTPPSPPAQLPVTPSSSAPAAASVIYTNDGFSPATVTVAKGGAVTFKNGASGSMWVGSDPHPTHNGYPATGGCIGSTFDSCKRIPPGSSWVFKFDLAGRWGYHNHLNPGERGTVIVQ